jgi:hypothetical protein
LVPETTTPESAPESAPENKTGESKKTEERT